MIFFFFFFSRNGQIYYRCEWFLLRMLSARAEARMSREKSEERDLIKSDCFVIEIVDGTRLGSIFFFCRRSLPPSYLTTIKCA